MSDPVSSPGSPKPVSPKPAAASGRRSFWPYAVVFLLGAGFVVYGLVAYPQFAATWNVGTGSGERVAQLEGRVAALLERTEALGALEARISALEGAASAPGPKVDDTDLTARIAALEAHANTSATSTGADARIAALERDIARLGNLEHDVQRLPALERAQSQRAAALAVLVLARAIDTGAPFVVEYDLARQVLPGGLADHLNTLGALANTGIARLDQLAVRFEPVAQALETDSAIIDPNLSWPWRWFEQVRSMIIIRPLDTQPGSSRSAVLSRARAAMNDGQFDRASAEMLAISADPKSPATAMAAAWASAVNARLGAERDLATITALLAARDLPNGEGAK